eukprot:CAMPEP_0171295422 /NCGR_PEP_ID=MMETSP0816-20121228/3983_1 /TAXON_ID=420281 /ORGANISM="Proboscia inermis, Strain CCAP1064/1" /LENGTH=95 /DNA_ID=CAMNT_0011768031 /DNA_START=444 /DNA_END=727 /DNA_ORIENTATION=-
MVTSPWETLATNPKLRRLHRRKREELNEDNPLQSLVRQYGRTPVLKLTGTNSDRHRQERRDTVTSFVKQQAEDLMAGACDGTLSFQLKVRPSGIA